MKRLAKLMVAAAAMVMGVGLGAVQGALLVYEPFAYTAGANLNGQQPPIVVGMEGRSGMSMSATWTATSNFTPPADGFKISTGTLPGTGPLVPTGSPAVFDGSVVSVPYSGNPGDNKKDYASNGVLAGSPDHIWASIALDPSVTATFHDNLDELRSRGKSVPLDKLRFRHRFRRGERCRLLGKRGECHWPGDRDWQQHL
jgi:hypothetical protein